MSGKAASRIGDSTRISTKMVMAKDSGRLDPLRTGVIVCLSCLFCLSCSTLNAEPEMKLEELVQKLDDANPWTVEAVGKVLGVNLTVTYSSEYIISYETRGLVYDEGLVIGEMELRLNTKTKEMSRLILDLSDDSSCFTRERIKKTYPDIHPGPYGFQGVGTLSENMGYWTERPWGNISFSFKTRRSDCLSGITFIPKKWK